jgi:hypothetical protein
LKSSLRETLKAAGIQDAGLPGAFFQAWQGKKEK